ncbi:hypothetical protein ACFUKV_34605 [Streptomyces paradoxus]
MAERGTARGDVLDEAQEIVLAALAEWDAQSVALERAREAS